MEEHEILLEAGETSPRVVPRGSQRTREDTKEQKNPCTSPFGRLTLNCVTDGNERQWVYRRKTKWAWQEETWVHRVELKDPPAPG